MEGDTRATRVIAAVFKHIEGMEVFSEVLKKIWIHSKATATIMPHQNIKLISAAENEPSPTIGVCSRGH